MVNSLRGIIPLVVTPFTANGSIDARSLRRVVQFEMEGGAHGIGVGSFAGEFYKLTDAERQRCAEVVAEEVNGRLPLVIGLAAPSTEAAIEMARQYAALKPAALMTLPPYTMKNDDYDLIEFYVELGNASPVPIMVQQSPQIPAYSTALLQTEDLARIANRCPNVRYFLIEGLGSARRIGALRERVDDDVALFSGVGGIALRDELRAGAAGLLPGVCFNEFFVEVWRAWEADDMTGVELILARAQEVVEAVSGSGHEYSLHARKYLLRRAGLIDSAYVRRPTLRPDPLALDALGELADALNLRISRK